MFHEIEPRKLDITYKNEMPEEDNPVIFANASGIMRKPGETLMLPTVSELKLTKENLRFLFKIDDVSFFMPLIPLKATEDFVFDNPRDIRNMKPMWLSYAMTLGFRLSEYYRLGAYCGVCGSRTEHADNERALVCPKCHNRIYPQIAPSVIVLIRNGEEIVLTKYQANHSVYRRYALVAGYVESGETPEEAVRREVFEEVGLRVKNIEYYKSQPWPISGALLIGFVCDLDGDNAIVREEDELAVAEWINRKDVPNRSGDVSLSSEMMEMFRTGRL